MIICLCNNISEKEIEDAIERGQQKQPMFTTLWDVSHSVVAVWIILKTKF